MLPYDSPPGLPRSWLDQRLRQLRVRQSDLARIAQVRPQSIYDMVTGRRAPSRRVLAALQRLEELKE
ncbi:MAG: helix-turn-helix domain-containing protein [Anaerolineales bacterium]